MAKNQFKFELKITGFELKVEGSKEDVAAITSSVANQLKGLTTPQVFGDNTETEDVEATEVAPIQLPPSTQKKKSSRRKPTSGGSGSGGSSKVEPIDFKNDPKKYSTPMMTWTTQQKALWILYVMKNEKSLSELSTAQIANTFNAQYKQTKTIHSPNISRDLGKVKLGNGALVGENVTANPHRWYLTDAGDAFVQNLIKGVK
ncbi:hypothetical protein [Pedobacter agri]|uniref:Uncharacterized protein n=1 Tax=Pedobacter agri TaxID=454586 RepID=A0A9X3DJE7_9SPHI|nr:hypothetical protein [Pedobacter agri]MCX3267315.1 hypothetical protein [Pedobacter agri]